MNVNEFIKEEINAHIDLDYLKFHGSLVPNIHSIKGVRVPDLRNIAKIASKKEGIFDYLKIPSFDSYEELTVYGLIIGYMKLDLKDYCFYLEKCVPFIDNWATCDVAVSNLKFTKKYRKEMYPFILKYLFSKKEFEVRFSIIMFLDYYLVDEYIDLVLENIEKVNHNGYYVKMAIAWFLSVCYIKYKEKTLAFLRDSSLDIWTYNKALQKIIESSRVSKLEKDQIRKMKKRETVL